MIRNTPRSEAGQPGRQIASDLVRWFECGHRDLPWRHTHDPYRIWVSEVMLQQTQVATVIPYYERFLERFPSLGDLATASLEEMLTYWAGLGYYARARNFHAAVREVQARYSGRVPQDPEDMLALPGVGAYTVGAVLSIAYNRPLPAVDGNVLRVLARVLGLEDDIARPATRRRITGHLERLIPTDRPGPFNQALMELGATVCTPQSPHCQRCPIREHCHSYREGSQDRIPRKSAAAPPRAVTVLVTATERNGRWLIVRRPPRGLYGGLWELPNREIGPVAGNNRHVAALEDWLREQFGLCVVPGGPLGRFKHALSHRRLDIRVYRFQYRWGPLDETTDRRWVHREQMAGFPFARLQQRILDALPDLEEG